MSELHQSPALFCLDMRNKSRSSTLVEPSMCSWCCPACKRPLKHRAGLGFFAHYTDTPLCEEANRIGLKLFIEGLIQSLLAKDFKPKVEVTLPEFLIIVEADNQPVSEQFWKLTNTEIENLHSKEGVIEIAKSVRDWLLTKKFRLSSTSEDYLSLVQVEGSPSRYAHEGAETLVSQAFKADEIEITVILEEEVESSESASLSDIKTVSQLKSILQQSIPAIEQLDLKSKMKGILTSKWVKECQFSGDEIGKLRALDVNLRQVAEPLSGWWVLLWLDALAQSRDSAERLSDFENGFLNQIALRCDIKTESLSELKAVVDEFKHSLLKHKFLATTPEEGFFRLTSKNYRAKV